MLHPYLLILENAMALDSGQGDFASEDPSLIIEKILSRLRLTAANNEKYVAARSREAIDPVLTQEQVTEIAIKIQTLSPLEALRVLTTETIPPIENQFNQRGSHALVDTRRSLLNGAKIDKKSFTASDAQTVFESATKIRGQVAYLSGRNEQQQTHNTPYRFSIETAKLAKWEEKVGRLQQAAETNSADFISLAQEVAKDYEDFADSEVWKALRNSTRQIVIDKKNKILGRLQQQNAADAAVTIHRNTNPHQKQTQGTLEVNRIDALHKLTHTPLLEAITPVSGAYTILPESRPVPSQSPDK